MATSTTDTQQPAWRKRLVRGIIIVLINIIIIVLLLEAMLRFIDPLGAYADYADGLFFQQFSTVTEEGYAMETGKIEMPGGWTITMLPDNSRAVPATNSDAACTIVLAGDSFTFGWGVDDADVWVNDVAAAIQDVHFINIAKAGYSITNVRQSIEAYPADGYVYLLFDNDSEPTKTFEFKEYPPMTGVSAYLLYSQFHKNIEEQLVEQYSDDDNAPMMVNYWSEMAALVNRDDTLIVGLTDFRLITRTIDRYPSVIALSYPYLDYVISHVDTHSTPAGNDEIARRITPHIRNFVEERCSV